MKLDYFKLLHFQEIFQELELEVPLYVKWLTFMKRAQEAEFSRSKQKRHITFIYMNRWLTNKRVNDKN